MPQWDWKCVRCGTVRTFTMRSLEEADAAKKWCSEPDCNQSDGFHSVPMVRQFPCGGFILVGDGFYVNDVKRKELRPIPPSKD